MAIKSYIPQLPNPELPDPPMGASGGAKALAAVLMIGSIVALVWALKR